jgi:hypothetical protein
VSARSGCIAALALAVAGFVLGACGGEAPRVRAGGGDEAAPRVVSSVPVEPVPATLAPVPPVAAPTRNGATPTTALGRVCWIRDEINLLLVRGLVGSVAADGSFVAPDPVRASPELLALFDTSPADLDAVKSNIPASARVFTDRLRAVIPKARSTAVARGSDPKARLQAIAGSHLFDFESFPGAESFAKEAARDPACGSPRS